MRSNFLRVVSLRSGDMQPLSLSANFPAAAMTRSSGMMSGLVMYLFLRNTVSNIRVALVYFIHIIHDL